MVNECLLTFSEVTFSHPDTRWQLSIPKVTFGRERVVCIVGPNGSGKSTLLRLAAGILSPMDGKVALKGKKLSSLSRKEIARGIGFLPQEMIPLFDNTVEEVVEMGRYVHVRTVGPMGSQDRTAINTAIEAVDAKVFRHRHLSCLSGGERRRALIASVIAQEPDVLLLDEPTGALDIHHAAEVMRVLRTLAKHGPTVVVVTHDINLASLFADRLLLMTDGTIHADGTPQEVVTPETMARAYGEKFIIQHHPETGNPIIVPRIHASPNQEVSAHE